MAPMGAIVACVLSFTAGFIVGVFLFYLIIIGGRHDD